MAWILDEAGFVTGTYDGPGAQANSTNLPPPADAAHPLRFVDGAWLLSSAEQPQHRIISRLAFRRRFTMEEKAAIEMAALDNPAALPALRLQAAKLRVYLKDMDAAQNIDLDDADTQAGVQLLVAANLLAAGRDTEILDAPIEPVEHP